MIMGTHCSGMKIAAYPEKVDFCKGCELIKGIVAETDINHVVEHIPAGTKDTKIILAIDDNPEAIDILCKYLGDDYTVIGLLGGDDAVAKAKQLKPMAITLDIMMPRKDGWEVLRELKNDPDTQDIPVIILSIVDDQRMGFSLGAAEYILKPVEKEVLLKKLKALEKMSKIKRILIVDSDSAAVRSIGSVLEEAEYQVTTAYNSSDAIRSIENYRPDLIVLNLGTPEMGFDVIEYLKAAHGMKDIPLIVLTQKELSEKEREQLNGRIRGILNNVVLTKEDLLRELKDTIRKMSRDS
jgi:CheY-like chemotaxis protein